MLIFNHNIAPYNFSISQVNGSAPDAAAENGDAASPGEEAAAAPVKEEKEAKPEAEKGVKRKFGETGLTAEELKPWNIR